jgi:hypothetical protein
MPTAVKVTVVPIDDGDGGAAEALTDAQGPGVTNVKWSAAAAAFVPSGVVTVTSTTPATWAGLVAVIWLSELNVNVAVAAPKWTDVAPVNPQPVMTTEVPPAVDPAVGAMPVTFGAPPAP